MGHLGWERCPQSSPPPYSTACVWPVSWGAWLGKCVPKLPPPPPIAPQIFCRYHGAPSLGNVSPIFTPSHYSTVCVWPVTWGAWLWKVSPNFSPPFIAPPVCGRYHGEPGLRKFSQSTACVWPVSWGTWVGKGVPNLHHSPPPYSTACVWSVSWGTWVGKGDPNLHHSPHTTTCVWPVSWVAWLGKGVPNLHHSPPSHSTARVWSVSWGTWVGKGVPNLHTPPPPPPEAPPVCGRYHGEHGLRKVSPIFNPPIAPPVCGHYHGAPGLGKVSPIFTPSPT